MKLNAHDRCDRCGAQAYVKYVKDGLVLMYCGHHNRKNEAAMTAQGFTQEVNDMEHLHAEARKARDAASAV